MRKIVASLTHSPLPYRNHDWCAHYDGEEEAGHYGYGATEAEAIEDFVLNCAAAHDERLDDPRGTYPFKRWWPDATETVCGHDP